MNQKTPLLVAAGLFVLIGAGCQRAAPDPVPQENPDVVEPAPVSPTGSATAPAEVSTGELHVAWSKPEPLPPVDVFSDTYRAFVGYLDLNTSTSTPEYLKPENYRQVGIVKDGPYAGGKMAIVQAVILCSMGSESLPYHFVLPTTGKPVLLAKHSPAYADGAETIDANCKTFDPKKFIVDRTAEAPDLKFPELLKQGSNTFRLSSSDFFSPDPQITDAFNPNGKQVAFTDPALGKIYLEAANVPNPRHGFYTAAPDGTVRTYALVAPFYDEALHVPQVTWLGGAKNDKEYWMTKMGGCGSSNYANVFQGIAKSDLKAAGTTAQGETVYLLKNENHEVLKAIYEAYAPPVEGRDTSKDVPYADFLKTRPIFFWHDPFGRLIGFQGTEFIPPSECGKPVIYLYPTETTEVSVKLAPQGGFTKTEPAYDGGWNVRATAQGELTDLKDGKSYPYLFWEGRGGLYQTPERGFMVAQKDVHGFLIEKLAKLGLNQKESADFREFWEPRMAGSPYYFVTFLGNRAMDALAPLDITPKPDSIIRILMDFKPLEAPIEVQGFEIHTPERDGFTVVEWGGVVR